MFDIGFTELLVLAFIGMVVIGPERLPGAARTVGRSVGQLRRFMRNLQNQIEQEVKLDELNKKIMEETKGQTFRNNDEPARRSHRDEDAEVPSTPPETSSDPHDYADEPEQPNRPPDSSAPEETSESDEVRKP